MPTISSFKGTIHYSGDRTLLNQGNGQSPTLAIDRPPLGVTNVEDFLAATSHFRDFLRLDEGAGIAVEGYSITFGPLQVIQVTRTP